MNYQEEIGKVYNAWTVLEYISKIHQFKCRCQCGTIKNQQLSVIKSGKSKSCGCSSYFHLLGTKIGRLTIDSLYDTYNNKKRLLCKCDCGNEKIINLSDLKKKNPTQSCGCIRNEIIEKVKTYGEKNLTGKLFGKWRVVKYSGNGKWLCECECGNQNTISTGILNSGKSKSCNKCYENTIDKHFFDEIDTQEKAYILGLLYADGCNYEDSKRIKIDLISDDEKILYDIKNIMKFNGDIHHYWDKTKIFTVNGEKKEYPCKPQSRLLIHNTRLSEQLALKGCVKNKTYELKFPDKNVLPFDLNKHFIRGLFDGDGSLGYQIIKNKYSEMKKFSFTITGTTEIVTEISNLLKYRFDCCPDIRSRYPERNNNNVTMTICGNRIIENIFNWLYEESNIHIDRKYNKYLELIEQNKIIDNRTLNDLKGIYPPKKIHNLLTDEIYESCSMAARKLNIALGTLTNRCKLKNSFIYYEDEYLKLNEKEKDELKKSTLIKFNNKTA